jgi:hypothetical protein
MTALSNSGSAPFLTKTFSTDQTGQIHRSDYDRAFLFDAEKLDVESIDDLHEALTWLEGQPHSCLIRGETIGATRSIRRTLVDCPKRGAATIQPAPDGLRWVMLDFDKVPVATLGLGDHASRIAFLINLLPPEFHNASFSYQWSSSAGLDNWTTLSCHLWFWLKEPWLCRTLFDRFHIGDFADSEVDPAPFTPNQIHYTARPIFQNMIDPLLGRSGFIRGEVDEVSLPVWTRPIYPPQEMSDRDHFRHFGMSRFESLLAEIGPRYHHAILRAVAHYFAVMPSDKIDEHWLEEKVRDAIQSAAPGRNRKANYLDQSYLSRVIRGARKFGGV